MSEVTSGYLLVCLTEECGEISKAAAKALRFGIARGTPDYGRNDQVLALEIGDLLGIVDELLKRGILDPKIIEHSRHQKIAKITRLRSVGKAEEL